MTEQKNRNKKIFSFVVAILIIGMFATLMYNRKKNDRNIEEIQAYATKYNNVELGYEFYVDEKMKVVEDKKEIFTKLVSDDMDISIFYDNFEGDSLNNDIATYNGYGNDGIRNSKQFTVEKDGKEKFGAGTYHLMKYKRDKLKYYGDKDKNNYITVAIPRTKKEIYTIMIKSTDENIDYKKIVDGLILTEKSGEIEKYSGESFLEEKDLNENTRAFVNKYLAGDGQKFGVYEPTVEKTDRDDKGIVSYEGLNVLEEKLDYEFPVILSYSTTKVFKQGFNYIKRELLEGAKENNKSVQLTLSTFEGGPAIASQEDKTLEILNGDHDNILKEYADGFKETDVPIILRINNEMNGDWVAYSTYFLGKDPDLYTDVYKYIYDFFKKEGVKNLVYVFNPNEKSFPAFSYNNYLAYYPGDEYVDIIGLTAYNTGDYYEGEVWRTFDEAYGELYKDYSERFKQPFMITEFSSSSIGGDKVEWMNDMFKTIKNYDRIKLAVLWNGTDWDVKNGQTVPAREYRIDETEEVIEVIRKNLQDFK